VTPVKNQQDAEYYRQNRAVGKVVQQRPNQPAHRARDAEAPENTAVNVSAETPEAQRRPDQMRNRYRRHRRLRIGAERHQRRQDAADSEPGDRGHSACQYRRDRDDDCKSHNDA
jgi:hypothetical protein